MNTDVAIAMVFAPPIYWLLTGACFAIKFLADRLVDTALGKLAAPFAHRTQKWHMATLDKLSPITDGGVTRMGGD